MNFGGLDLQALKQELEAVKLERQELLRQAAELTVGSHGDALPPKSPVSNILVGTPVTDALTAPPPRRPKLSWGSPARARSPHLAVSGQSVNLPAEQESKQGCDDSARAAATSATPIIDAQVMAEHREASRKAVLRELLSQLTGESGPCLDHFSLDVSTVVAVANNKAIKAAEEVRQAVERVSSKGSKEQAERSVREAKLEKELTQLQTQVAEERSSLQSQVNKLQQELDAATKDRRGLMAKAGQQKAQAKEMADAAQAARERAESVEKQVAGAQQRQREAEKLRAEAERRAKGADAALAAAKSENEQLQQALDKANKKHAKAAVEQVQAAATEVGKRATSALDAALLNAVQSSSAALGELQEGLSSAQQARADVDAQLHQVGAELAELRTVTQSLRPKIMAEVGDLRGDVQAMVGSFQAAFQAAAQRVAARTEELTRYDARLASLGPDGLDGLYKELDEARAQLARSDALRAQLTEELRTSEAHRHKAAVDRQVQEAELQMAAKAQGELAREVAALRTQLGRAEKDIAAQRERITALVAAEAAHKAELAAAEGELHTCRMELDSSKVQVEQLVGQVAAHEAATEAAAVRAAKERLAAVQQAQEEAAHAVRGLRDRYFAAPTAPLQPDGKAQGSMSSAAVLSAAEEAVGLRLCHLTHEELVQRMEVYTQRQALLGARQAARAAQPQQATAGSTGNGALRPSGGRGEGAGQQGGVLDGVGMDPVQEEVVWLEGCLLLVLLEMRQQARQVQALEDAAAAAAAAAAPGAGGGAPGATQNGGGTQGGGGGEGEGGARAARYLTGQLVAALAQEKRQLQRRISQLEGGCSTVPPRPFTSYIPLRRSLSARSSVSSLHSTPPPALPPGPRSVTHLLLAKTPPPAVSAWRQQQRVSEPSGVMGISPEVSQGPLTHSHSTATCHHAAHHTPTPSGPPSEVDGLGGLEAGELEEVLSVLDVLDDSGLRSSRGLLGLKSATVHSRMQAQQQGGGHGHQYSPIQAWAPASRPTSASSGYGSRQQGRGGVLSDGVGSAGAGALSPSSAWLAQKQSRGGSSGGNRQRQNVSERSASPYKGGHGQHSTPPRPR